MKGWGPKSSVCVSKPRENKLFGGMLRYVGWVIPGVPEQFEKNVCVEVWPLMRTTKTINTLK